MTRPNKSKTDAKANVIRHAVTGWTAGEIEQALLEAGVRSRPEGAGERFVGYLNLLGRWNERINLTAVRNPGEIVERHFVESAWAGQELPSDIPTLLDYGSGAGFPGIPIAICRPEIRVTLAESQGKKAAFLREAVRTLDLDCEVWGSRVEELPQQRRFAAVILRAVDKMQEALPVAAQRAEKYLLVLTTGPFAVRLSAMEPDFHWLTPVALPNAAQSVLAIGRRKDSGDGEASLSR